MKRKTDQPRVVQEAPAGYGDEAIVIYQSPDGIRVDVKLDRETVWLTQKQIAQLLDTERSVVTKHLRNIFKSGELIADSVSANFAQTAADGKTYQTAFYNLDAVISVGYRVNSKRGTQFRIWATSVLRDHLLKGYTVNEHRLKELNQAIRLIADVAGRRDLSGDEAKALLSVVADYSFALDLLDDYDHQRVAVSGMTPGAVISLDCAEARRYTHNRYPGPSEFWTDRGPSAPLPSAAHSGLSPDLMPISSPEHAWKTSSAPPAIAGRFDMIDTAIPGSGGLHWIV